jgi:hypothetical protein
VFSALSALKSPFHAATNQNFTAPIFLALI